MTQKLNNVNVAPTPKIQASCDLPRQPHSTTQQDRSRWVSLTFSARPSLSSLDSTPAYWQHPITVFSYPSTSPSAPPSSPTPPDPELNNCLYYSRSLVGTSVRAMRNLLDLHLSQRGGGGGWVARAIVGMMKMVRMGIRASYSYS